MAQGQRRVNQQDIDQAFAAIGEWLAAVVSEQNEPRNENGETPNNFVEVVPNTTKKAQTRSAGVGRTC